jgi:hypothetical protein
MCDDQTPTDGTEEPREPEPYSPGDVPPQEEGTPGDVDVPFY